MVHYLYTNVLESLIADGSGNVVDKKRVDPSFENLNSLSKGKYIDAERSLLEKHKSKEIISLVTKEDYDALRSADLSDPSVMKIYHKIISRFTDKESQDRIRQIAINHSAESLRRVPKHDILVIQTVNSIDETDRMLNTMSTRLREWYSAYNPELSRKVHDNIEYAKEVIKGKRKKDSIGAEIDDSDIEQIRLLAEDILALNESREKRYGYLEAFMTENYPNISSVATPIVGAHLIQLAGSLKRMMGFPSSTIQTLGAENAMFRHLKTGSRPPKYCIIMMHPLVNNAKNDDKGKVARAIASKVSIAAKMDYFKGDPNAGALMREELDNTFK